MFFSFSGKNAVYGGERFTLGYEPLNGIFVAGEGIIGVTSGAIGVVTIANTLGKTLEAISWVGHFAIGETIGGNISLAEGTITSLTSYTTPRATIFGDAFTVVADQPRGAVIQNYDTGDSYTWTIATSKYVAFDLLTVPPPILANALFITGFHDSSYVPTTGASNITSIVVEEDDNSTFTSPPSTLATILPGSPSFGRKTFGLSTLFVRLSPAVSKRYLRVKFNVTGSVQITIGNIFFGVGIDSVSAERWNIQDGWTLEQIDRSERTERDDGSIGQRNRRSVRTFAGTLGFNQASFHLFLDAIRGEYSDQIDDPARPIAVALDPDNVARAVTGQHYFSGLWRIEGGISAVDSGVSRAGVFFWPTIELNLREHL